MELEKSLLFKINNMDCEFRTMDEADVSKEYVDGLKEQTEYIENIPVDVSFSNQEKYVKDTINSEDDTICGLFLDGVLVGTAGIQLSYSNSFLKNIDFQPDYIATVGIFLFNKNYREMGLWKVLVWAATYLFHKCTKTEWFGAGMEKKNKPSLKSFLSSGYQKVFDNGRYYKVMTNIEGLKKPETIKEMTIEKYENE